MQAKKLIDSGCERFLASIAKSSEETKLILEDVRIVREYILIFFKVLPGLPPDKEIAFSIELVPGTVPIS